MPTTLIPVILMAMASVMAAEPATPAAASPGNDPSLVEVGFTVFARSHDWLPAAGQCLFVTRSNELDGVSFGFEGERDRLDAADDGSSAPHRGKQLTSEQADAIVQRIAGLLPSLDAAGAVEGDNTIEMVRDAMGDREQEQCVLFTLAYRDRDGAQRDRSYLPLARAQERAITPLVQAINDLAREAGVTPRLDDGSPIDLPKVIHADNAPPADQIAEIVLSVFPARGDFAGIGRESVTITPDGTVRGSRATGETLEPVQGRIDPINQLPLLVAAVTIVLTVQIDPGAPSTHPEAVKVLRDRCRYVYHARVTDRQGRVYDGEIVDPLLDDAGNEAVAAPFIAAGIPWAEAE